MTRGKWLLKDAERLAGLATTLDQFADRILQLSRIILKPHERLPIVRTEVAGVEMFLDELHGCLDVVPGELRKFHDEELKGDARVKRCQ